MSSKTPAAGTAGTVGASVGRRVTWKEKRRKIWWGRGKMVEYGDKFCVCVFVPSPSWLRGVLVFSPRFDQGPVSDDIDRPSTLDTFLVKTP